MKKALTILIIAALLFTLAACGKSDPAPAEKTEPAVSSFKGSGTEDDPWLIGAEDGSALTAVYDGDSNSLWISGEGDMADFDDPAERPWNGVIADIEDISVFGDNTRIGNNAFRDAGKDAFYLGFFMSGIREYGECCFENANLKSNIFTFGEECEKIGSRAFAGCCCDRFDFNSAPEIADDAFDGVEADIVLNAADLWSEESKKDYGGALNYSKVHTLTVIDDYGTDDITSESTLYIPDGESFDYNAEDYICEDGYHFVEYQVLEGNINIEDPSDPLLSVTLDGNAVIMVVYTKD